MMDERHSRNMPNERTIWVDPIILLQKGRAASNPNRALDEILRSVGPSGVPGRVSVARLMDVAGFEAAKERLEGIRGA